MSELARVVEADFTGVATQDGESIQVVLHGTADYTSLNALEQLIDRVKTAASRARPREAVIDLHQLEFMNSSCFKVFVSWVSDLQELSDDQRYILRFLSSTRHHWQKRSLASLRHFATDLIVVETQ